MTRRREISRVKRRRSQRCFWKKCMCDSSALSSHYNDIVFGSSLANAVCKLFCAARGGERAFAPCTPGLRDRPSGRSATATSLSAAHKSINGYCKQEHSTFDHLLDIRSLALQVQAILQATDHQCPQY